jgi:naphthoate synthase
MADEQYEDVRYETTRGVCWITIDRPHRYDAFRMQTVYELVAAFRRAWADREAGAIVLTGAGDKAFCAGGDQKERAESGDYGESQTGPFEVHLLHRLIRDVPKPVIAAVNGYAIGGGHILHVVCDVSIAAEHARFGQAGPKVGSFEAGFGAAYLARVVGEKRAREIWFLCDQYDAATAERWGLVNKVVPLADLRDAAQAWGEQMCSLSPTALRFLKHAFNADSDAIAGSARLAYDGYAAYEHSAEAQEGVRAYAEKRPPDFGQFR